MRDSRNDVGAQPGRDPAERGRPEGNPPSGAFIAPTEAGRFETGTILAGRYRIVGLLGRGGMGEVYRADDLKLGRAVALKFLPEGMDRNQGRLVRFLNEVRTALRVTHLNVCRVHDVGEFGGYHFLSMEYVDGEDLATLLQQIRRVSGRPCHPGRAATLRRPRRGPHGGCPAPRPQTRERYDRRSRRR